MREPYGALPLLHLLDTLHFVVLGTVTWPSCRCALGRVPAILFALWAAALSVGKCCWMSPDGRHLGGRPSHRLQASILIEGIHLPLSSLSPACGGNGDRRGILPGRTTRSSFRGGRGRCCDWNWRVSHLPPCCPAWRLRQQPSFCGLNQWPTFWGPCWQLP